MKIALLCLSPLRHDSRVLRHAALLAQAGHEVRIFAQAPLPDSVPTEVTVLDGPGSNLRVRAGLALRQAPATLWPATADFLYWASSTRFRARAALSRFAPQLVIANDWRALPLAIHIKRCCGSLVIYDSHEFASEEFGDSQLWRLLARRHVIRLENRFIRAADAVMTVSDGIASALVERYDLPVRPAVIANMPQRHDASFRPTGDVVTVLYQGVLVPRRGLEVLVSSVPLWPNGWRLVLRGPSQGGFIKQLEALAAPMGGRVVIEPAVAPGQVVKAANQADIGVFLLADSTIHAKFALPNKIFEYIAAGLMIVSSDLPEIRKVVDGTGAGLLLKELSPSAIAAIFAQLTPEQIDGYKRRSLAAAAKLNFETEGLRLLSLVDSLAGR